MTRPSWTTHSHAFAGCIQSGTGFPDGWGFGKCVPEFAFGMGCGFRLRALVENATRNLQSEWDAVSQRGRKRKLHPTPDVNSGTRFPDAKKATRRGLQLIYVADTPMTSRAPTTGRLSRRRHIRFIASSARKEGHLMWPSSCAGLFEILRKHPPCRGSRVPAYESDVLSNSLKSFGLPLPRLAFMHWPTKKPMTFWLPSRYCCA